MDRFADYAAPTVAAERAAVDAAIARYEAAERARYDRAMRRAAMLNGPGFQNWQTARPSPRF